MDHDRNEDGNEDADYSDAAWFGSASRTSRRKFGRSMRAGDEGSVSPPGPYDSPYASPPGPYDSPSASDDEEISATKVKEPRAKPVQQVPAESER